MMESMKGLLCLKEEFFWAERKALVFCAKCRIFLSRCLKKAL